MTRDFRSGSVSGAAHGSVGVEVGVAIESILVSFQDVPVEVGHVMAIFVAMYKNLDFCTVRLG